jgi:COP9 signalosome complex subunit 6
MMQLVLINVSDHCMRTKALDNAEFPRVIGCLLGQHNGRTVDIISSFEMIETECTDGIGAQDYDHNVYALKREQYQEVFKSLDVIGWYVTGTSLQSRDLALHKKLSEQVEAPILLSMDPQAAVAPGAKELPIELYESGVLIDNLVLLC